MARILQVCNTDFYLNRFLAPLVMGLAARGHEVEVACDGGDVDPRLPGAGVVVHPFAFPKKGSPMRFAAATRKMTQLLRDRGYRCVNSHNRNASIVARLAAWRAGVPVNLYTAHGFYFHDGQSALAREATVLVERALARITDHTLSQSREDIDIVVGRGITDADSIDYIGNGVDLGRFHPRGERAALEHKLGLGPASFRVATTGRIVAGKGFGDLVEACARIPGARLVVVGGNIAGDIQPYEGELRERAAALGVTDRVHITGIVSNVEDYLATADVFVLPSYREGMPRALIEAMAMDLPSIATAIRGCREIVVDGETGWLYPAGDVDALATRLAWCQDHAPERAAVGRRGGEAARRDFSEAAYVDRQISAIESLL